MKPHRYAVFVYGRRALERSLDDVVRRLAALLSLSEREVRDRMHDKPWRAARALALPDATAFCRRLNEAGVEAYLEPEADAACAPGATVRPAPP